MHINCSRPASVLMYTLVYFLLVSPNAADYQFPSSPWTRIGQCTSVYSGPRTSIFNYTTAEITTMANRATRVRMCSAGSTTDCVTSVAGSFPITNLQAGQMAISHPPTGVCQVPCATNTWTGPSQRVPLNMWNSCASRADAISRNQFYWACNNGGGIHMTNYMPGGQCGWTSGGTGGDPGIDIFIDEGTFAPTSQPTSEPTGWYESYSALSAPNLTQLEARITGVETRLEAEILAEVRAVRTALRTEVDNLQVQVDNLIGNVNILNASMQALNASVGAMQTRVDSVNATATATGTRLGGQIDAITAALVNAIPAPTAASTCTGAACAPQVQASGSNLLVTAPGGTVQVQTAACSAVDLCQLGTYQANLIAALNAL
eukprot:m.165042 g.165042  ORF g.165042 m.165042 type:complete len:375 (-) comp18124_c0_seq1:141-1265(-)